MFVACCVLFHVFCLLFAKCWLLFVFSVARCQLCVTCCLLFAGCWSLLVCCLLRFVACWLLFDVWSVAFVVVCRLDIVSVAGCVLFAALCSCCLLSAVVCGRLLLVVFVVSPCVLSDRCRVLVVTCSLMCCVHCLLFVVMCCCRVCDWFCGLRLVV